MSNTTHTKEPTEQKEKPKGGQLLETIDLRDYFAAKAMQGIFAGVFPIVKEEDPLTTVARAAYAQADAMLKAREA